MATKSQLFNLLTKYSDAFYNTGSKLVTDEEFDLLKEEYEKQYGHFTIGSKVKVGNTVSVSHSFLNLAGTLDKINSTAEFVAWTKLKKLKNDYYWSYKIDGNSIILEYEYGKLVRALTRGKEGVGKDLTAYFTHALIKNDRSIVNLPKIDDRIKSIGIACECTVLYDDFDEMIESGATYNNPRSAVSGMLSEDGIEYSKYLSLIPFKIKCNDIPDDRELHVSILNQLQKFYNDTDFKINAEPNLNIEELYNSVNDIRFTLPFMIDGVVIECMDNLKRSKLGYTDNRPNYAIALKLPYIEAKTNLLSIEWFNKGNSARYTPVVYFTPVVINNNTYQKVSLSNYKRFKELKAYKDQEAILTLRGDILGYIDPIPPVTSNSKIQYDYFTAIKECEYCNSKLKLSKNKVFLSCENSECELVIIGTLQNFLEKHDIKGIKRSTLTSLFNNGHLNSIEDFFYLDYDAISKLEGFGAVKANNIEKALDYFSTTCWDYKLIGSLNIPFFSTRKAHALLKIIDVYEFLDLVSQPTSDALIERLGKEKGFKETILTHIYNGFDYTNLNLILYLLDKVPVKLTVLSKEEDALTTFNICVTGSIKLFKNRKELETKLKELGHKLVDKVTKTTDFLMTNDTTTSTEKLKAAKQLGTKILTEEELCKLFQL